MTTWTYRFEVPMIPLTRSQEITKEGIERAMDVYYELRSIHMVHRGTDTSEEMVPIRQSCRSGNQNQSAVATEWEYNVSTSDMLLESPMFVARAKYLALTRKTRRERGVSYDQM